MSMETAAKRPKRSSLPATPVGKSQNGNHAQDVDNDLEDQDDCDDDYGGGSKTDSPAITSAKRKVQKSESKHQKRIKFYIPQ
jgi:hypothetical protein